MRKSFLFSGIFLTLVALPLNAQTASGMHPPMPKPKNLKILPKDISHDQLMKVMHGFSGSLGVKCGFCHVQTGPRDMNFASDAKPEKRIARTMMRMTHEIDTKYMAKVQVPDTPVEQQHVSCGTCHRGQKIPAVFVPPPEHGHGTVPPTSAPQ